MATEKPTEPDATPSEQPEDEDVEGHAMTDPWTGMHLAQARERDMKQAYQKKALEEEARRPHRKESR
jgi:hypothetical protein